MIRRWWRAQLISDERFDRMSLMQKKAYLRHPSLQPRCDCGQYCTRYGLVDGPDQLRHGPDLCQPLAEVIR